MRHTQTSVGVCTWMGSVSYRPTLDEELLELMAAEKERISTL